MAKILSVICFLCFAGTVVAESKSTGDWSRRDSFVKPEDSGEKILQSWSGGNWQEKGISGSFRFVITEHKKGKEKLYLQWVTSTNELAYSLSVKELNFQPAYDLDLPKCIDGDNCRKISIAAKHYYESTERSFTIKLNRLGNYAFGM